MKLKKLHRQILSQAKLKGGVLSYSLGDDIFMNPIPYSQINTLIKHGYLKVHRQKNRNRYETTLKGKKALLANISIQKDA